MKTVSFMAGMAAGMVMAGAALSANAAAFRALSSQPAALAAAVNSAANATGVLE